MRYVEATEYNNDNKVIKSLATDNVEFTALTTIATLLAMRLSRSLPHSVKRSAPAEANNNI